MLLSVLKMEIENFHAYNFLPYNNSKKQRKMKNKAITYRRRLSDMKATGIVRRIDDLGRIVIPKEIRRTLRIREADPLEIYTDREGEI